MLAAERFEQFLRDHKAQFIGKSELNAKLEILKLCTTKTLFRCSNETGKI